jgi:hypothetical protein
MMIDGQQNLDICECITKRGDWNLARCVINQSKIRWALGTFKLFKSVATDGIAQVLLQQGTDLCRILRARMAYGFIPTGWRKVKMTLNPNPGKLDYTKAKTYCPISL